MAKMKNIHLNEDVIEILTIEAVKKRTTFKLFVQDLLIKLAENLKKDEK